MRKMIGFVFGLLGKLLLLSLAVLLSGVLYVGVYFYQKSGEPMTVAEAQQRAPGLTFRDFWASRVAQWRYWDDEQEKAGLGRSCEKTGITFTVWRSLTAIPFVLQMRAAGRDNVDYYNQAIIRNNNVMLEPEVLYDEPLLDASWAEFELSAWWSYSNNPGSPKKALNQRRSCSTQYPTSADVSTNQMEANTSP
jgi:hypothetical protein